MNSRTQSLLTILVSSILLGSAGLWLASGKSKGAIVGATTGAAIAAGYVYHDTTLKRLASRQQKLAEHYKNISKRSTRPSSNGVAPALERYHAKLNQFERALQAVSEQLDTYGSDINQVKSNLKDAERRLPEKPSTEDRPLISLPVLQRTANPGRDREYDDELERNNVDRSIEWFQSKAIEIESSYEPDPQIDTLLDGLSAYLGENYGTLGRFHRKLKNNVGLKLYFNLANHTQREISIHNQFLRQLKASNFLRFGRIIKSDDKPDYIIAISYDRSDIKTFLNGVWFERYVYHQAAELFNAEGIKYECLRNLKITYSGGEESELDLFFLVDKTPLLIECKSGQNYDSDVEKFVQHKKKLGLNTENSIFAVLDIDESEAYIRSKNWQITVVDQVKLIEHLRATMVVDDSAQGQDEPTLDESESDQDSTAEIHDDSGLASFFKQQSLNLAPDHRSAIFAHLIQLIESDAPITFSDITKTIRDRMSEEALARRRIGEVLNCLRYSDVFRDSENQPVRYVFEPIHHITPPILVPILERKCMEFYSKKILQLFDPDFFDVEGNVQAFERLTHGMVPSRTKIEQFKEDIAQLQTSEVIDSEVEVIDSEVIDDD